MAATEVIYFPLWAQLAACPLFAALFPPEPVAQPPPCKKARRLVLVGRLCDRRGRFLDQTFLSV